MAAVFGEIIGEFQIVLFKIGVQSGKISLKRILFARNRIENKNIPHWQSPRQNRWIKKGNRKITL